MKQLSTTGWTVIAILLAAVLVSNACGDVAVQTEVASVENGALRVSVDAQDGKLLELTDLAADFNQVGDAEDLIGLWKLEVTREGKTLNLEPGQTRQFRVERLPAEQNGLRLIWDGFDVPDSAAGHVEAVVRLDEDDAVCRWKMAVDMPPGLQLQTIHFPRISGVRRQDDERLAVPVWMGQEAKDPRQILAGADGKGRRLTWTHPGFMSMQCLAFYRNGGNGLYAACDDDAIRRKTFAFWGTPGGDAHYEMVHYPEGLVDQGNHFELPYSAVLGTFQGDWITAAERYRAWAVDQPWTQQSRLRRGLVADWVLETGMWVWNRGRSPGVLPPAARLQEKLGAPVSVFWHWWHGCPYDIGFPEYLPPREGTEPFREAVARAHADNLHTLVYMNQRAWGLSTKSWESEGAERFAVKAKDGKIRPEVYNIFTGQALISMCLGTPFWRNKYAGLAEEAVNDLGVDGIYMDQACAHQPCYDPDHGHPPGGGDSWIQGFHALSEDIRGRCRRETPVVLAGEGCGEAWIPYLDLMLALQVSQERYSSPADPWEVIPFFHAVYHPYAVTYGNYSSLVMPPYDELWPAEFAPAEPLALLDRKFSRQFYLEQARTFVWGQQPTVANFLPILLEQRAEEMDYVMRLARVRSLVLKYLLHGEFLRPPRLNVPEVTSDFSRLSIYAGQKDRLTISQRSHPLALAGAWRASDGDVAIALASVSDEPLPLSLDIDRKYYALPQQPQVFRIDAAGRRPVELPAEIAAPLKVTLAPRDICILEFQKTSQ